MAQSAPSERKDRPAPEWRRDVLAFAGLAIVIFALFLSQGAVYSVRVMVEASCYALLALGLTIQWGYAGMFNIGIMGFLAAGAASSMLISFPANPKFWASPGPMLIRYAVRPSMARTRKSDTNGSPP